MDNVAVFIDTSTLLDIEWIEKIKWRTEVFKKVKHVAIIIVPFNFDELNGIKDGGKKALKRQRAITLIKQFDQLTNRADYPSVKISEGVEVYFAQIYPDVKPPLRPDVQDDHFIASFIEYKKTVPPDTKVCLLTNDIGMKGKAKFLGIEHINIPEKYILPEPEDPQSKLLTQMEKRLRLLESAYPLLSITFGKGSREMIVILSPGKEETQSDNLAKIKQRYPLILDEDSQEDNEDETEEETDPLSTILKKVNHIANKQMRDMQIRRLVGPSILPFKDVKDQVAEYNAKIVDFHNRYEGYLSTLASIQDQKRRSVKISLHLENEGPKPATEIRIKMAITKAKFVMKRLPSTPIEPQPPNQKNPFPRNYMYQPALYGNSGEPNVLEDFRQTEDGFEINYLVKKCRHIDGCELPYFFIERDVDTNEDIQLSYSLTAPEVPVQVEGNLKIVIEQ